MIKSRFRDLAKQYHPDKNPSADAAEKMSELVEAYDALLDGDLAARAGSNTLIYSIEAFTIDELRADGRYDVYALRIALEEMLLEGTAEPHLANHVQATDNKMRAPEMVSGETAVTCSEEGVVFPLMASLDDSVLDLRRSVQATHGKEWGLAGRRCDRGGIAAGWELVFNGSALSYHLFVHDYGIEHGSVLHAVVRGV